MDGNVLVLLLTDAVARLSMFENCQVHFFLEQFQTHLTVPLDVSVYPIENAQVKCSQPAWLNQVDVQ